MLEDKTIYIHIGIPKTASSFLQQKVFPSLAGFQCLTLPVTQHNKAFGQLQYADDTFYDEDFVKREIEKLILPETKKLIISDEGFSGRLKNLNCNNRSVIAQRLQRLFPHARILMFLRGQEDMLWAHYSQSIKNTLEIKRIGEYYRQPENSDFLGLYSKTGIYPPFGYYSHAGHCSPDCFRYSGLIELYTTSFHKTDFFLYEDLLRNPDAVKTRMEALFGARINIAFRDRENTINKGIYDDALNRKWFSNKTYFVLRKKWMQNFAYLFYKKRAERFLAMEKKHIHSIAEKHFPEDNRKIISLYPEAGIQNHPDKYFI